MIGELSGDDTPDAEQIQTAKEKKTLMQKGLNGFPSFKLDGFGFSNSEESLELEPRLSDDLEDVLLKESTSSFASWVHAFVRRVVLLLENLPEEGASGSSGATESELMFLFF
jgi:proteasome activator subunit 4